MVIGGQTFLKCCRATHSTSLSDTAKQCELGICFIYNSECIVTVIKKIFLMPIIVIFSYTSSTIFTFVPVLFFIFILFKLQPVCLGGIDLNAFQGFLSTLSHSCGLAPMANLLMRYIFIFTGVAPF